MRARARERIFQYIYVIVSVCVPSLRRQAESGSYVFAHSKRLQWRSWANAEQHPGLRSAATDVHESLQELVK